MSNKKLIHGFHAVNARLWQNPKSVLEIFLAGGRQDVRAQAVLEKAAAEKLDPKLEEAARSLGASPFHEAVGQALKNLGRMTLAAEAMPAKLAINSIHFRLRVSKKAVAAGPTKKATTSIAPTDSKAATVDNDTAPIKA